MTVIYWSGVVGSRETPPGRSLLLPPSSRDNTTFSSVWTVSYYIPPWFWLPLHPLLHNPTNRVPRCLGRGSLQAICVQSRLSVFNTYPLPCTLKQPSTVCLDVALVWTPPPHHTLLFQRILSRDNPALVWPGSRRKHLTRLNNFV